MTEELQTQQQQQQQKPRLNPQDFRNQDLVTKLMAATPPYLYSPAIGPHNFFFSEMLRSLVQNKRNESFNVRTPEQLHQPQAPQQPQPHQQTSRRPRKRSWSQQRSQLDTPKEVKEDERPNVLERPLELTNKQSAFTRNIISKFDDSAIISSTENSNKLQYQHKQEDTKVETEGPRQKSPLISEPSAASLPPSDLILPPPPPVWYPPLYPPYGIDPLHFFIDLRVSGHIYDRKKESSSPTEATSDSNKIENNKLIGANDLLVNNRQGSAFSVPKPRDLKTGLAINLSSSSNNETIDLIDLKENKYNIIKNTNYVMQNLPRIYNDLNIQKSDDEPITNVDVDNKSVISNEDGCFDDQKYKDNDLNVISDEESIAVDEN